MTVNVELLEATMQHIEDNPHLHNQTVWVDECGTAACFAGWACLLSGWQPSVEWNYAGFVMSPDTLVERSAYAVAVDLLDLDDSDAVELFAGSNTRPMLRRMVKDLSNGESLRGADEYRDEAEGGES